MLVVTWANRVCKRGIIFLYFILSPTLLFIFYSRFFKKRYPSSPPFPPQTITATIMYIPSRPQLAFRQSEVNFLELHPAIVMGEDRIVEDLHDFISGPVEIVHKLVL